MADDAAAKKKATDDAEPAAAAAALAWPTGGLIRKVLIFPTDGTAVVQPSGLLELTNGTAQLSSHVVHRTPLRLRRSPGNGVRSFSASFVFGIIPPYSDLSGHGIVFFVGKDNFSAVLPSQYLGLLNSANNGNATNHIFGVELDAIQSKEF
uniref:Lectin-domain containing receptor kinase A4.2 n=1 Tax=Aegilops tauschii TaxID=37682 RepID=M8C1F4_AEGTA